uniref:Uncharacterized protein n=1 Tax=Neisseria meningitidis alpha153 TaxID=663926 RepID=C6SEY8_NEIME|nr:hypothetical protein predicted by Glimmer/Critica [Neisseria meningitidis alpha153]
MPYYLYCLRLRRLVLIFVNPLYFGWKPVLKIMWITLWIIFREWQNAV